MSNARLSILQARAVKDKAISDSQFRTLAALGMYADEDGWCYPMLSTLGKDLSKSKQAVGRDTIALRKLGYLEVRARYDKNGARRSSMYRLKYDLPPVNVDDSTPSTPEVDTPSTPEVDVNDPSNAPKNKPKGDLVDGELKHKLKPKSIRQAITEYFFLNVNWETKTSRQWMEWAVSENITAEQLSQAADLWRKDKSFNWQTPTLKGIFEKWPMLTALMAPPTGGSTVEETRKKIESEDWRKRS